MWRVKANWARGVWLAVHRGSSVRRACANTLGAFRRKVCLDGVTIVATPATATRALEELLRLKDRPHAWDTETADIKLGAKGRSQSPVNHGRVVCATCFCGEDADFGTGPRLFIDNSGPAEGLLEHYFKPYFEEASYKKVFHNYSFDRHMLRRHGIALSGFHADTMHMARLYDTSRAAWEGSVKARMGWAGDSWMEAGALGPGLLIEPPPGTGLPATASVSARQPQAVVGVRLGGKRLLRNSYISQNALHTMPYLMPEPVQDVEAQEVSRLATQGYGLKGLAAHFGLADQGVGSFERRFGTHESAAQEAHDCPESFPEWVHYATSDAVMTYGIFEHIKKALAARPWHSSVHAPPTFQLLRCPKVAAELRRRVAPTYGSAQYRTQRSMWDLYQDYLRDLGDCLADLEREGVEVDLGLLQEIKEKAQKHVHASWKEFSRSLASVEGPDGSLLNPDAELMNVRSATQLRVLLFGGARNLHDESLALEEVKEFPTQSGGTRKTFKVRSLGLKPSIKIKDVTPLGWPRTSALVLDELAGDPCKGKRGTARDQLIKNGLKLEHAERVEHALLKLREVSRMQYILSGFAAPLQEFGGPTGRIHPSWLWDTSTGRLACRSPNLQNLPTTVKCKDTARLRDVFRSSDGNVLVVADYSQLELRVLAQVANCSSMIEKLTLGGDYHSEVAAEMFPHVRSAVELGEVVTSDDGSGKPTVKDIFGTERSKAKAINFGIIYGKGPRSLAEDLGISEPDARELIRMWLATKPEVERLTERIESNGLKTRCSVSILGRQRHLPFLSKLAERHHRAKSLRAAVNFVIQGSAADIVIGAMLQLWRQPQLRELGFKLVMQVHDEFVLEGPEKHGREAAELVRQVMMHPFRVYNPDFTFKVPLEVDVGIGSSFGKAKV